MQKSAKCDLIVLLDETNNALLAAITGSDLELVVYPRADWSIRDIVGHIATWDRQVALSLNAFKIGNEYSILDFDEDTFNAHITQIEKADVVVLCNIPVGFGNLKNIEAAEIALTKKGKKLVIVEADPIDKRDFTNGEAAKRINNLKKSGAVVVTKPEEEVAEVLGNL